MRHFYLSSLFCTALFVPHMASASPLQLDVGGYTSIYGAYTDQAAPAGQSFRTWDMRKDTEIHLDGKTKLDNGVTAGVRLELDVDRSDGASTIEESYFYLESTRGKLLVGEEDGAGFALQVTPLTADPQIDGVRPNINTIAFNQLSSSGGLTNNRIMHAQDMARFTTKATYLTPVYEGFQAGVSYTPGAGEGDRSGLAGLEADDNDTGTLDAVYEAAARYAVDIAGTEVTVGGGYAYGVLEADTATSDDRVQWNIGTALKRDDVRVGVSYLRDNNAVAYDGETQTIVTGASYKQGPFTHGISYLNRVDANGSPLQGAGITGGDSTLQRVVAGTQYAWGPGLVTRASVAYANFEIDQAGDIERDAVQVTVGSTLNF